MKWEGVYTHTRGIKGAKASRNVLVSSHKNPTYYFHTRVCAHVHTHTHTHTHTFTSARVCTHPQVTTRQTSSDIKYCTVRYTIL